MQNPKRDQEDVKSQQHERQEDNPWLQFEGMFEDDPTFDDYLEAIHEYRQQTDALWDAQEANAEARSV
jgi:hypothetical protein